MTRKYISKAGLCALLTAWLFLALCTFIITCYVYLRPLFHVLSFRRTDCRVESVFYTTQYLCACPGEACRSLYPCFITHVSVNVSKNEAWTMTLYVDTDQQANVVSADQEHRERCSLMVCHADAFFNRHQVAQFHKKYGRMGEILPCYYNPYDVEGGAVLRVILPGMHVFHAIFWPFIAIVLGLLLCIVFCKRCRKLEHLGDGFKEGKSNDVDIDPAKRAAELCALQRKQEVKVLPHRKRKKRSLRSLWVDEVAW